MAAVSKEKLALLQELSRASVQLGVSESKAQALVERLEAACKARDSALLEVQRQRDSARRLANSAAGAVSESEELVLRLGAMEEDNRGLVVQKGQLEAQLGEARAHAAALESTLAEQQQQQQQQQQQALADTDTGTDTPPTTTAGANRPSVRDVACTASDEVDLAIANADLAHEHQMHLARMQTIVDEQTRDLANAQVQLTSRLGPF
jgi:chromosome segregation ATPase